MRSRFRRAHKQSPELDITAFMNLMVILVPFLLITAVFNQVNILEMNLPQAADEEVEPPSEPPPFLLEVVIRKDAIEVFDRPGSLLKSFPKKDKAYDFKAVSGLLVKLKTRFPDEQTAMLLLEPDIEYDNLIQMMDVVRAVEVEQGDKKVLSELFPEIALGDAPEAAGGQAK